MGFREIPSERLLLETDSPYISLSRQHTNYPQLVGELANHIAAIRDADTKNILEWNAFNALKIFKLIFSSL